MTENKRFYIEDNGIWDNTLERRKPLTWRELCDTLNELQELRIKDLEFIEQLKKENEQLKQFKEDVFTKIDMHLRMLPTERDNEFNEDDGDPSLYVGAIYMLETLKEELKE